VVLNVSQMAQRADSAVSASSSPAIVRVPSKVIIIGPGWYGIAAAKTYLEVNSEISLTIIDAGLCADTPSGAFEFTDLSMFEVLGVPLWSDLTGDVVHGYLEKYARKHGILERCKLETEVVRVVRSGSGWTVAVRPTGSDSLSIEQLRCDKLIVATGQTSKPIMPNIDKSAFKGKIFHSKDFGQSHTFLTSDAVQNVTVVGGNKLSVEVARLCALA
jgi:dimethylaniline monooxygenase (N-oxide forming)